MADHIISDVAVYLRKSRGDALDALDKHRTELLTLCDSSGWRPTIYEEIASGDSVENRPEMQQLLRDVADDMFDAVLVVDYDRLGRGDAVDQATIKRALVGSNTLIITPAKVYDLSNESDDMMTDFQGFFARMEYRAIKKRLARGKKRGAAAGNWVAGPAPFPYKYDTTSKRLMPEPTYLPTFRFMVDQALAGKSLFAITLALNTTGALSPRGREWSHVTVKRVLTNSALLGTLTFGKTANNKRGRNPSTVDRGKWYIVENAHEAVLDEPTYLAVQTLLKRHNEVPRRARTNRSILSGLIRCGRCGYLMTIAYQRNNGEGYVKSCQKGIETGAPCRMLSSPLSGVLSNVYSWVCAREEQLMAGDLPDDNARERILTEISFKTLEHDRAVKALERVIEMHEMGDTSREEYHTRREKRQNEINAAAEALDGLTTKLRTFDKVDPTITLSRIATLKEKWGSAETGELNVILKDIIEKIVYYRDGDNLRLEYVGR